MGTWSSTGHPLALGERTSLGGQNVSTLVFETGRPARVDAYHADDGNATTAAALRVGLRSAVGTPISVAGRLWGVMIAGSTTRRGAAAGHRDAADRIHRTRRHRHRERRGARRADGLARQDRRRRRRDTAADRARSARRRAAAAGRTGDATASGAVGVPPEFDEHAAELGRVIAGMTDALDELREIARGIHPAILAKGGLMPATACARAPLDRAGAARRAGAGAAAASGSRWRPTTSCRRR